MSLVLLQSLDVAFYIHNVARFTLRCILHMFYGVLSCDYVHLTHKYTQKELLDTLQSWCSCTKIELLPEAGAC